MAKSSLGQWMQRQRMAARGAGAKKRAKASGKVPLARRRQQRQLRQQAVAEGVDFAALSQFVAFVSAALAGLWEKLGMGAAAACLPGDKAALGWHRTRLASSARLGEALFRSTTLCYVQS